jgi:hypothetical protein
VDRSGAKYRLRKIPRNVCRSRRSIHRHLWGRVLPCLGHDRPRNGIRQKARLVPNGLATGLPWPTRLWRKPQSFPLISPKRLRTSHRKT